MRVVETVSEMHRVRAGLLSPVAMMATLGGMHAGHEALLERVSREGASRVASLFLNPAQFNHPGDLDRYPRDTARDLEIFEKHGVDIIFKPTVDEMYPPGSETLVDPGPVASLLEGAHRPGHFRGVATVVAKILTVIRPDVAVWGAKDAQQNVIIRRLSEDLLMNVRHVIIPTVRADDGLALSSRNEHLSPTERESATVLYRSLCEARTLWLGATRNADALRLRIREVVGADPLARLEYASVADPETLRELDDAVPGAVVSLAAFVGGTRLIDSLVLQ